MGLVHRILAVPLPIPELVGSAQPAAPRLYPPVAPPRRDFTLRLVPRPPHSNRPLLIAARCNNLYRWALHFPLDRIKSMHLQWKLRLQRGEGLSVRSWEKFLPALA